MTSSGRLEMIMVAYLSSSAILRVQPCLNIGNHTGFRLALDQDRAQHQLQGLFGGTVQVDHRVKIAVPHSDKLPKSKHRHYRHTNRQQDIKEVAHFAGTIHIGCLTKLTRDP